MNGYVICPKYMELTEVLRKSNLTDSQNPMAFLNFDCILLEMTRQFKDIGYQSVSNKPKVVSNVVQFVAEVVSHFRVYFRDYTLILYYTDLNSKVGMFRTGMQQGYHYRENYISRFNSIKFRDFGALWIGSLCNLVKDVIRAVPNVFLIQTTNIDSSLVPLVFANEYPSRKKIVYTWDGVDSLLWYYGSNLEVVYDARKVPMCVNPIITLGREALDVITNAVNPRHYGRYAAQLVFASAGSDHRSLFPVGTGGNHDNIAQWLQEEFGNNPIPANYVDVKTVSHHIKGEDRFTLEENFRAMDLETQYRMLSKEEITQILYQMEHNPIDPQQIIQLFPNITFDWDRLFR